MVRIRRLWMPLLALVATAASAEYLGKMEMGEIVGELRPRFMLGPPPILDKRQDGCGDGKHSCRAINATNCCDNTEYCYVNTAGTPKCCNISRGSCPDDPCPTSSYACTVSGTSSCCASLCPATTLFKCADDVGGSCCALGFSCASSACVLLTSSSSASSTSAPVITTTTSPQTACTTGQTSCPASVGGGCCDDGTVCTMSNSALLCAASITTTLRPGSGGVATSTNTSTSSSSSSSLSTGAKAGIAIGIVVGAAVVASLFIGICLHRRRRQRAQQSSDHSGHASGRHGAEMSEVSSPGGTSTLGPGSASHHRGLSNGTDYFGPVAGSGPFTEPHGAAADAGMSLLRAPSPRGGAVPVSPQSPGDITTPVEIGGLEREREMAEADGRSVTEYYKPKQEAPVELPG